MTSNLTKDPFIFDEYFEGEDEFNSPFLTPHTRKWGEGLSLKAALLSFLLLAISFFLSFHEPYLSLAYALLIAVYFLAGIPSLIDTVYDLSNLVINIDVLMTLAAFGSVVIGSPMEGALLLVLFSISGAMEDAVTSKAKNSLKELHRLSPTKAWVVTKEGNFIQKSVKDIQVDNVILIKSGEVVPLDGEVIEGISSLNLIHLTGENLPVMKKVGDLIPAGAKNMEGALKIRVTHLSSDSTLAKIIQLVTEAQEAKPKLQQWFDRLSKQYATTIILLFIIFAVSFPFLFDIPFLGHEGSLYRSLAFLIAASPCALIIAIPIAYLSALSISAKNGVLLKGGVTLDALVKVDMIAFDKTGTLTTGNLKCLSVKSLQGDSAPKEVLEIAYAMEVNAVHPIAKAIQGYAEENKITPAPISDFKSIPGYGLEANFRGMPVYIGQPGYFSEDIFKKEIDEVKRQGYLIALMKWGDNFYLFTFEDTPREKSKETLIELKNKFHLKLIMLTGDHEASAQKVAAGLNLDEVHANLRPEDKLKIVSDYSSKYQLCFVGDGVNDAPALARSTVGIGMGKGGSRAAVDASDVVLLQDNIDKLAWLFKKAYATKLVVRQNLILATLAIFIAALPALAGFIPLWLAVVMHEGGTVLVGLNGLRLLK